MVTSHSTEHRIAECPGPTENGEKTLFSEFEINVVFLSTPVTEKFI